MEDTMACLTDEQMKELEQVIIQHPAKITSFARKAFILMLRKSDNLTKAVALKFNNQDKKEEKPGKQVALGVHAIGKSIRTLLREMKSPFLIYGYYGNYGLGCSLDSQYYSKKEEQIIFTIKEIEAIKI